MEFSWKNSDVHFNKINMSANSRNFSGCSSAFVQQYENLKKWNYFGVKKILKIYTTKLDFYH